MSTEHKDNEETDNLKRSDTTSIKREVKLENPNEWADGIGSLSVISALIFGFSIAVLTSVGNPEKKNTTWTFGVFVVCLFITTGLSATGLVITSIMYHNIKGFQAYNIEKALMIYEKKTYFIKNIGNYLIYVSWIILVIAMIFFAGSF